MRTALIFLALFVSGCSGAQNASPQDRIVSQTGGETLALVKGVCMITRTDDDEDTTFIVSPARCQE